MKRSILLLILIASIGCSKNKSTSKFAGAWTGTYSTTMVNTQNMDTGTVNITVNGGNNAAGILQSLHGGSPMVMKGTVDPTSGAISLSAYGQNNGIVVFLAGLGGTLFVGSGSQTGSQPGNDSGSGSLAFPWATRSSWQATKD